MGDDPAGRMIAIDLDGVDRTMTAAVGGKAAHLGELMRIDGVDVPAGFAVTTSAFRRVVAATPGVDELLGRLERMGGDDSRAIGMVSADIRRAIESTPIPPDINTAITDALARHGDQHPYAVRSSATAEDLPTASFAGQQDSYLDIVGPDEILRHVVRCWASLFTERAVRYRQRQSFDHRRVHMAVVVQRMVQADAAGVLFTADPVSGNRTIAVVEATRGLGEALVSGLVNADHAQVRDDEVIAQSVADGQDGRPVLTDAQLRQLVRLGRRIEAHLGAPQDIEWCLVGDGFRIVQTRPITTLFPVPAVADEGNHVYLSVGHQQMMTGAMKPLGLSLFQMTAMATMVEAGSRLWVDVTDGLAAPTSRAALLAMLARADPLFFDAVETVLERDGFLPLAPDTAPTSGPPATSTPPPPIDTD